MGRKGIDETSGSCLITFEMFILMVTLFVPGNVCKHVFREPNGCSHQEFGK